MFLRKKGFWQIFIFIMVTIIAAAFIGGCDSGQKSDVDSDQNGKNEKISGEDFVADHFTMTVVKGYNKMDISGGVQAYQGTNVIEVWVRPSTQDALEEAKKFADQYSGTSPEEVELFGSDFYVTTFTAAGTSQTKYIAVDNGNRIEIGIAGEDHANNADLQGMLNSIRFK